MLQKDQIRVAMINAHCIYWQKQVHGNLSKTVWDGEVCHIEVTEKWGSNNGKKSDNECDFERGLGMSRREVEGGSRVRWGFRRIREKRSWGEQSMGAQLEGLVLEEARFLFGNCLN